MGDDERSGEIRRREIWYGMFYEILYQQFANPFNPRRGDTHLLQEAAVSDALSQKKLRMVKIVPVPEIFFVQGNLENNLDLYMIKITVISAGVVVYINHEAVFKCELIYKRIHGSTFPLKTGAMPG